MTRHPVVDVDAFERKGTVGSKLTAAHQVEMTGAAHIGPHTIEASRAGREAKAKRCRVETKHVEALGVTGKRPVARKEFCRSRQCLCNRYSTDIDVHVTGNPVLDANSLERERAVGLELAATNQVEMTCATNVSPHTVETCGANRET